MLSDTEAHYRDLIKRSEITGELCLTWFQPSSANTAMSVLHAGAPAAPVPGNFTDLIDKAVQEQMEGGFGGFLLLGEATPWFLAIEYTGDRAYKALEQLSSDGKALCLIGSRPCSASPCTIRSMDAVPADSGTAMPNGVTQRLSKSSSRDSSTCTKGTPTWRPDRFRERGCWKTGASTP
ncbi:hypothetical protein [Nonomuraea sp. NPDC050310]|uniref:hypothetical protein n=1 Tax=Nonomuraea sp. NPDC050310 TaxID=3154935 RepID=UPI0033CCB9B7